MSDFQTMLESTEACVSNVDNFIAQMQDNSAQMKVLSFNASIEAVHAGTAGAGFRIVASEFKQISETSNGISEQAVTTMRKLEQALSETRKKESCVDHQTEIIARISELSTQTDRLLLMASRINTLALYASIEAARAGNVGVYFRMVADDFTKLAEHSTSTSTQLNTEVKRLKAAAEGLFAA